jgi:hypothetical protein
MVIPLRPLWSFMACSRVNLTFTVTTEYYIYALSAKWSHAFVLQCCVLCHFSHVCWCSTHLTVFLLDQPNSNLRRLILANVYLQSSSVLRLPLSPSQLRVLGYSHYSSTRPALILVKCFEIGQYFPFSSTQIHKHLGTVLIIKYTYRRKLKSVRFTVLYVNTHSRRIHSAHRHNCISVS